MNVLLNGEPAEVPPDATVEMVLAFLAVPPDGQGVAVAVDAEVIPRGAWARERLSEGAQVEILHAVQGG